MIRNSINFSFVINLVIIVLFVFFFQSNLVSVMPRGSKSRNSGEEEENEGGGFLRNGAAYLRERKLRNLRKKVTEIESKLFDISTKRDKVNQQLNDCVSQITALSQEIARRRALLNAALNGGNAAATGGDISSSSASGSSSLSPTMASSASLVAPSLRPLPTASAAPPVPLVHGGKSNSGGGSSAAPARRFVLGCISTSTAVVLALPQNALRLIAFHCDPRTRAALACTCRKMNWVVSDPSVASGDLDSPCKPYPEGAPWAAPPLFCVQPQTAPTHAFLSTRGGSAAAASALAQQKIRSQVDAQTELQQQQQQQQQDQQGGDDNGGQPNNRRRLQRTKSRHQDMGLMLALNINPRMPVSSTSGSIAGSLGGSGGIGSSGVKKSVSGQTSLSDSLLGGDGQKGGCSLQSSPSSIALDSPREQFLSDSESSEVHHTHVHHHRLVHHHNHHGRRKVHRSDSSSDLSDECSSIGDSEPHSGRRMSANGRTLYMNSAGASPRSMVDISPGLSMGGVTVLRRGIEPTDEFEKICLVGDSSVGKTTIANILEFGTARSVEKKKKPTFGFSVRSFSCLSGDNSRFDVQLYDIGGNERRNSLLQPFFADAGAVVLCYSVDSRETLLKALKWIALMRQSLQEGAKEPALFILGFKSDLPREVQIEDVSMVSVNSGASFLGEFSQRQAHAIEEAFCRVASCVYLNTQFRRFKSEVCVK